jgi:tricorn protease
MALQAGDVIIAVDTEPFAETDTLESRLTDRGGKETLISIRRTLESGEEKSLDVLITPTSFGAERQLRYKKWRRDNAKLVDEWSDGRIGYIHIQGMNQPSLDVFERDLYAAAGGKDGLIIDVRNNGGGWTADRLLSSIMVQKHAYTIPRGGDPDHNEGYPQDRLFIQRYTLPINMLCNEKSFSNAEITSHAFKTLQRGTLVGQETYGGVISTGGWSLIDGTFVRLPFRGWYVVGGTDMENHGAVPDIIVPQTPEAESANDDQQLRTAVDDLMKRIR